MAKFIYTGKHPMSFSLPESGEHTLHEGNQYELPQGNNHIKNLEQTGYLVKVTDIAKSPKTVQRKKQPKKTNQDAS